MNKTITIKEDNILYTNKYGLDSWTSFENGVKAGEMRIIDERIYYAGFVHKKRWSKDEVNWYLVPRRFLPIHQFDLKETKE